jgi:hypothetical protein
MHSATDLAHSTEQQKRITIAFLALSWFFVLLRIWTRTYVISNFGWDDSVMILAGVSSLSFVCLNQHILANGNLQLTLVVDIHCILCIDFIH